MEEDKRRTTTTPPFEQDHATMRAAATKPVTGPAANDRLAAIGGRKLPGDESHPEIAESVPADRPKVHEPIPGERDPSTLTTRQPGAVSGQFTGADIPSVDHLDWIDDVTAEEHVHEGGGANASRPKKKR